MSVILLLERMPLARKLISAFVASLVVIGGLGLYNLTSLRQINEAAQKLYDIDLLAISHSKQGEIRLAQMGRALRQAILAQDADGQGLALRQLADAEVALRSETQQAERHSVGERGAKLLASFHTEFERYRANVERAVGLLKGGQRAELLAFVSSAEFQQVAVIATAALGEFSRLAEERARQSARQAQQVADDATRLTFALVGVAVLLAAAGAILISLSIQRPIARLRDIVEHIAAGHYDHVVPFTDYANEIGALARSVGILQRGAKQDTAQRLLKTHLAQISSDLQMAASFTELAQRFLHDVTPLLNVGHAVFYVYEEERRQLRLLSGHAFRERKHLDQYLNLGQGLVGQCALERSPIIITQPPPDYVRVGSGLGDMTPRALAAMPILRNERLLGVIELATLEPFDATKNALLDGVMPMLAMNMEILERGLKTQRLLEETQDQATRLEEQRAALERQQHAIEATETWFQRIIDQSRDGLVVVDAGGAIVIANPPADLLFGGSLAGGTIDMLPPQLAHLLRAALSEAAPPRGAHQLPCARSDGKALWLEVSLSPLPAAGARGPCVCASLRETSDATEPSPA